MLPKFIGVGAQRAGTTWIYNCLRQHPEIFLPQPKELHFFSVNYEKGMEWYENKFSGATQDEVTGEITPNYMYREDAMQHMAKHVPDAKLFMVLRNPFERTFSAYRLFHEKFKNVPFHEAIKQDQSLIERSCYMPHIERVYRYYPAEQVKILFYDDLNARKMEFLNSIYTFIGVSENFRPENMNIKYNRMIFPEFQRMLVKAGLGWIPGAIKATPLGGWIRRLHGSKKTSDRLQLNDEDLKYLNSVFHDDILQLQQHTGRDLTAWLSWHQKEKKV